MHLNEYVKFDGLGLAAGEVGADVAGEPGAVEHAGQLVAGLVGTRHGFAQVALVAVEQRQRQRDRQQRLVAAQLVVALGAHAHGQVEAFLGERTHALNDLAGVAGFKVLDLQAEGLGPAGDGDAMVRRSRGRPWVRGWMMREEMQCACGCVAVAVDETDDAPIPMLRRGTRDRIRTLS